MSSRPARHTAERRTSFSATLRVPAVFPLYLAEILSIIGDQLARVALSVLVFQQTNSVTQTALTYALTFLPAVGGGIFLAGIADRVPRRTFLVSCDCIRALLVGAMTISGLPIAAIIVLLAVVVFIGPAFTAAEVATLADILDGEGYRVVTGLRMITSQIAQVTGFAVGAAVVGALSPRWGLASDAISYALSALIITLGTATISSGRPFERTAAPPGRPRIAIRILLTRSDLRALTALAALAGFFVVPEGLAAPYVAQLGGEAASVGILMAAIPFGSIIGAFVVVRMLSPRLRQYLPGPMAVGAGIPLIACAASPNVAISTALWFTSGMFFAYMVDAMTSLVEHTPRDHRAGVVGVVSAVLLGSQGIGIFAFGLIAAETSPGKAIGLAGAAGSVCALSIAIVLQRQLTPENGVAAERRRT